MQAATIPQFQLCVAYRRESLTIADVTPENSDQPIKDGYRKDRRIILVGKSLSKAYLNTSSLNVLIFQQQASGKLFSSKYSHQIDRA
ncbi:hypothetical protein J6590_005656 [Homalodisca vitripennis]|nr:hypothetical protein J6590_005656 [Homalodisca vitripennis]